MKTCVRCGLPLPDNERGSMHYNPDDCIRLLQLELQRVNTDYKRITQVIHKIATTKINFEALL